MAITDLKVSEAYSGRDIASLSDRPNQDGISASTLKARFDQLGKEVIPKFNDLIDLLSEGQIEVIMIAYEEGSFDGASIVSAEFVGNDIVFTKDNSETVTLSNAKLDLKGDVGASIISGEFIGNDIVFTKDDDETVTLPNAKLELQGEQGVPGASFTILGRFDTLLDLQTAHPTGEVGEHWSVGTVEPYDVYVWNPDIEDWDNIGQISPSNDASEIEYDNTTSGLLADNVKDAIDELENEKMELDGSNSDVINMTFDNGSYLRVNADRQLLEVVNPDGTTLQSGSELWYSEGKATENINEGDNCMFAGSQGDHYLIKKAVASELASEPHLYAGIATKTVLTNEWIKVTRWGLVNNINTNGLAYGTKLYFNPATLGLTSTLPSLPNARIYVGMVVKQGIANGILLVDPKDISLYTNSEIDTLLSAKQPTLVSGTNIKTINGSSLLGSGNVALEETIIVALSDETTNLTTGTAKATFRMPYACKLTSKLPRINLNTVSSSGLVTVDVNKNGSSIFNTRLTIDVNEKTSVTATTPCVLTSTPTTFTDDDEITCDIDVAGTGAKGLKLTLFVERT